MCLTQVQPKDSFLTGRNFPHDTCWIRYDGWMRHFNSEMKYESLELTFADLFPCEESKRFSLNRPLQSHKYDTDAPMTNVKMTVHWKKMIIANLHISCINKTSAQVGHLKVACCYKWCLINQCSILSLRNSHLKKAWDLHTDIWFVLHAGVAILHIIIIKKNHPRSKIVKKRNNCQFVL